MSSFRFTHAIVTRIPKSFVTDSLELSAPIDYDLARKQHEAYVRTLRDIGLDVIELPADENHPDCVFVEDTAIVCNGNALICKPGSHSRIAEVNYMKNILEKELELPTQDVENKNALLIGGDVLFTGKEFFVGLSSFTNEEGAIAVAEAFPEFPCTPIKLNSKWHHLKSCITMAAPGILCVGSDPQSQEVLKKIERVAAFRYQTLTIPDSSCANVVFANGVLMFQEEYSDSTKVFQEKMSHWDLKSLKFEELSKAKGRLTFCSLLIRKTKHLKSIL